MRHSMAQGGEVTNSLCNTRLGGQRQQTPRHHPSAYALLSLPADGLMNRCHGPSATLAQSPHGRPPVAVGS